MSSTKSKTLTFDPRLIAERDYWIKKLSGEREPSGLWPDHPRPPVHSGDRGAARVDLTGETYQKLSKLSSGGPFLIYAVLLAALKVCLHRYTGSSSIVVGSPARRRDDGAAQPPNALAIVDEVRGRLSFRQLLLNVRQTVLEAYSKQQYPFARLIADLDLAGAENRCPLFDVALALRQIHVDLPDLKNDLTLTFDAGAGKVSGVIEFNRSLFRAETVERFAGHFVNVLRAGLSNTDELIGNLEMLGPGERRLLEEWNATEADYERACAHELFERQAARAPGAAALVSGGEAVSYRALDERANRLARHLRRRGVGGGSLVGVMTERSVEMIVSLLAVLKAGAAYVPIDPAYPAERIDFMLSEAGARALLTQARVAERVGARWAESLAGRGVVPIRLDSESAEIARESAERVEGAATDLHLAYVIYTSGSTGRPKAVMVPHRALVNRVEAMRRAFGLGADDRLLQFVSLSFDALGEEVFPVLASGAALVLPTVNPAEVLAADLLLECERAGVTTLHMPAVYWHQMADELSSLGRPVPRWLRLLIVGGESPSVERLMAWAGLAAHPMRFFNAYGPTEATITSTLHEATLDAAALANLERLPIGRPLANTRVFILDRELRPVPVGAPGELHVGGDSVAWGYFNQPDATAEKFIPDHFAAEPGARLYKTGDLARHLPDGQIEFLGRADEQLKIRGHRIEAGEIAARLRQHEGVRDVAVVAREDAPGDKRLVAYVVPDRERPPSEEGLRGHLKERLPEYMIPSAFVLLQSLPLTPHGKLDRRALPAPEQGRAGARYVEPRTDAERLLARIWREVLGVSAVGVEDDFFALGGDSILSLQCVARANEAGLRLTPRQMFEHPTVAALAQAAAAAGPLREGPGEDVTFHGPVAPTPIQRWFFEQEVGAIDHYNQAVLLEVREEIDASLVERAVRVVLARHDALWLRFVREGAGWRQFNDSAGAAEVAYRFVDLAGLEESERRRRMDEEAEAAQRGLSLAAGPLARAVYFSLGGGRGARLLVVVHHLAVDGVSWRVLLEDLQRACDQARRGEEIRLPPKTTPFVEWAGRLEEYARSGELEEEFDYWIAQSSPEAGAIPVDYKDGLNTVASARTLTTTLSESETSALLRDVPRAYNTRIDDALLAALCRAYRGWSGSRSLLVDMEGHGREEVLPGLDISRTVGCFTTIYPLLLDSGEADDPGSTLKRVKEKLRGVPRGGIGYGLLKYLGADEKVRERLRGAGRAEISFNYLGQFTQVLGAAGLFAAAKEGAGALRGESGLRSHALGLLGSVNEGRLTLTWSYSENIHARESVEDLAARNLSELRRLIGHCTSGVAGGRAPSDFPLARLDQQTVERLSGPGKAVEDIYPLSPLQEGMLFHELYAPHSGVNIAQFVYSLQSDIDVEVFRRVWQRVVDRHPALRTSFVWEGSEELLQVVHGRVAVPWEELSWVGLSKAEQRERLRSLLRADRERGFDLSVAPLTRLTLIRLSEDSHQLVWSIHHLVGDGWCTSLLLKEVLAFYDAFSRGEDVQLPLPRPYGDYIAWLRRQDLSRAESFWRRTLAGVSAATPLGVKLSARERAEAAGDQPTYDRARLRLPAAATGELQAMARARGLTLNTLVQGAWALLLSRYGGGRDVVFGATVSGRPAELRGVEGMIGLFINTLPVRARVEGGERIGDWLRRLQAEQAEARAFEYSPLARVQDWSGVGRGHSLFDTLLVFENYPVDAALKQPGAKIEVTNIQAVEQTNYPLTLLASVAQELSLQINYDRARFAPPVVERMLEQLSNLLRAMAADPDQRLDDLPMLSARERRQLIEEWNATDVDYERACVHELFERQVERTPDAPALSFEDQSLTYRELDARANQLARRLRRCRVGPEVLVAVMMERSVEMVVSLLAIMKAGGAYVPIDPDYPAERVNFMLDEARVPVLLTQERLVARLREQVAARGVSVLSVDGQREEIARESAERVEGGVGPDNLAYVIYTSGSTGRPKGAMNTHAGVGNRLQWMQDEYGLTGADRVLQKTPYTFDVSAWEFFWPLTCGAQLVVASPGGHRDAAYLRDVIRERGITTLHFVPSMLAVFLEEKGVGQCESLRDVICSGEALPAELARRFSEKLTAARLSNLYGPTEAAIDATFWRCEGVRELEVVPVGRPIANMRAYVLDDRMEPVPAGVTGELYLGGVGLARGYLRGPEMTAGKFVPDPFGGGRGARLYRTGDLARHLADGSVEYVGRTDDQIKLRGYRIELGEIESVLRRHDAVREAAVVLRDDGRGAGKRLAAYFVAEDGEAAPGGDELREHLAAYLPEYMIPAAFVGLGRMPLTANGKLDRAALPEPERVSEEMRRGRVAPQSEEERALAEVWAEVLKLEGVGVNDNFFALGGDSILSIQVVSRAAERGLKLSPRDLFAHQTIAELAAACRPSAPGLAPPQGPVTGHVPLTPIQHWFFERQFNRPHHWNQAVLLGLRRRIEAGVMERAVELLLEHHDALRLRFRKDAGAWRQYNAGREERRVFSEVDLSRLPEEGGERRAAIERAANEAQAGLDLGDGPLVRAVLFETGPRQKLLLVVHHLAVDGVSWRILLEDLQRLCEQLGRGESPRLPPKGTSYKEWAERLELYAQSAEARQSLDYWRRLNWAAVEPLPEDYPGGANTMRSAEVVSVSLDEAQTRLLLQRAPQSSGAQVNDLLLAALVRALQWWRGTSAPVSVEIEGHGREELSEGADVTRTVGWFTSRYPVVLEAGPEADARRALAGVAEQLRRVPRRGVDYGVLRYLSADDEARELLKGHPEPELTFNYLGQLDQIVAEESGALYELAEEGAGDSADKDERREQKLSVNARVVGGRLQVAWGYSRELHRRETIEMVARRYAEELQELIGLGGEAATAAAAPGHVPSLAEGVEIDEALEEVEFE